MLRNEMIREEFSKYGSELLDDTSLISLIMGEKVAAKLIENNLNTLFKIDMLSYDDLTKIGISDISQLKLKALIDLSKRGTRIKSLNNISSPKDVVRLCDDMTKFEQEVLRVICLNTKNDVVYQKDVFKGGLKESIVHPREIFKVALSCSAASIIIIHNHPSGNPTPSKADINITDRTKESGKVIGINLLDHIIVGSNGFTSLKEKGIV